MFTAKHVHLERINMQYYEVNKEETEQIACHSKDICEYARKAQTEKLAEIIKQHIKQKS